MISISDLEIQLINTKKEVEKLDNLCMDIMKNNDFKYSFDTINKVVMLAKGCDAFINKIEIFKQ